MTSEAKKGKHTPGPWLVIDTKEAHIPPAERGTDLGFMVASSSETSVIALGIEEEADAHLIAAAPALLKALEIAFYCTVGGVRWCSYCGHDSDSLTKPMPHTSTCWVPLAEAAIAAARGQTNEARSEQEQLEGFLQDGAK